MAAFSREYPLRPLVGIGVALFKPQDGSVLLIRRGRPPAQGQWSLPGGAQRLGETAEQAARRELGEETGTQCGELHLAGHMDSIHADEVGRFRFHYTILDFCALWRAGEACAGGDAEAADWVQPHALDHYNLTPELLGILAVSRRILGSVNGLVLHDPQDIPVIINSFNRLSCLQRLVAWLQQAGTRRIVILDNASDYPPLLDWYRSPGAATARILRLEQNSGALALWEQGLLQTLGIDSEYIYTDSDVIPAGFCPKDAIGHLHSVLYRHLEVKKAGLGLRLDNLPDSYRHRDAALLWEYQFWRHPAAAGLMWAPLDTTFALYRAGGGHDLEPRDLRTTHPYLADHLGWHCDSANPTAEDRHYDRTARRDVTSWTGEALRPNFASGLPGQRTPRLLQLQNGADRWPGWEQGDDLDLANLPEASFDGFHIAKSLPPLPVMQALHRLAKPNARLLARLPAKADPEAALQYGAPAYEGSRESYSGDWAISALRALPSGAWLVHLFAVKPIRARARSLEVRPRSIPSGSDLSPEPAYDLV